MRYLRTPSGRFLRTCPNRLLLNLKVNPHALDMPRIDVTPPDLTDKSKNMSYATEEFDINCLAGVPVVFFGAGSVGSYVLRSLESAQLKITLVDSDRVALKHTRSGRTIYDPSQIGRLKVHAAKEKIETNCFGTTIDPLAYNVSEIPDSELTAWFKKAALLVLVIDDPAQIIRINRLAYPLCPIVQCGVHRQGHSAHIVFTLWRQTPCLACTLGITSQQDLRRLDSEPAAGIDISIAAQLASRVILDLLYSQVTRKPVTRWEISKNILFVSNTQKLTPDGPGLQYQRGSRRPDCTVCH